MSSVFKPFSLFFLFRSSCPLVCILFPLQWSTPHCSQNRSWFLLVRAWSVMASSNSGSWYKDTDEAQYWLAYFPESITVIAEFPGGNSRVVHRAQLPFFTENKRMIFCVAIYSPFIILPIFFFPAWQWRRMWRWAQQLTKKMGCFFLLCNLLPLSSFRM